MSIEKTCWNKSQKWSSQQLFLKIFSVGLLLFLYFNIYTVIITNIQWSKQPHFTSSCLWNLHVLVCLCLFQKDKSLHLLNSYFSLICLWISRTNSFMEGDVRGMFKKVPDWKTLFLLKINKIQAVQISNIMQSSSTSMRKSGPITRQKNLQWSIIRKIFHIKKNLRKSRHRRTHFVYSKCSWGFRGSCSPRKSL